MQRRKKLPSTAKGVTSQGAARTRRTRRSSSRGALDYIGIAFVMIVFGAFMYEFGALQAENKGLKTEVAEVGAEVKDVTMHAINAVKNLRKEKTNTSKSMSDLPHLYPPVPYLPIFAEIPNSEELIKETLRGVKPTIAGIVALLQKFLAELHDKNMELSANRAQGNEVIAAFWDAAKKHLVPFDEAYRGRPIFPIREDESVFLSLAAFREHLLADTLSYAFDNAKHPEKLFIGAVVQNCFGKVGPDGKIDPSGKPCKTGAQVVGKNKKGRDMTKVSDAPIDKNGVYDFCNNPKYKKYCDAGQVRAVYVHETESLGPAMARYYASKLWGGETYFVQTDSHLQFAVEWDEKYKKEIKSTSNFPKSILSSYPPGFNPDNGKSVRESPGARLCTCSTNVLDPNPIIRINSGASYNGDEEHPTQIPFVAAGFFFARAEFLVEMPFDPFIPWCVYLFCSATIALCSYLTLNQILI